MFYYSISQKVTTLSGRRFITVSGVCITLSCTYYIIGRFLLHYRARITVSVGTTYSSSLTPDVCSGVKQGYILAATLSAFLSSTAETLFRHGNIIIGYI